MEEFGKALALEPYLQTVVLCGALIKHGADAETARRTDRTDRVGRPAPELRPCREAVRFRSARRRDAAPARTARAFVLNGEKGLVGQGDSADKLIVSARVAGARRDRDGVGLFLVDADAPGVTRRGYPTQDGQRAAEISLADVRVEPQDVLGHPGDAMPVIERAVDEAIAALSAEAVGAMSEALAMTVEYMKTRKQFGVTIGSFQALQHRASDMVVALEQARSMMYLATMSVGEDDAGARAKAMSAAKVADRPLGQVHRPAGGAVARRHRDDLRVQGRPSVQAPDDDRSAYGDADRHVRKLADQGSLFA